MNDREMQRLADTVGKIQKCICSLQSIIDGSNTILQGVATESTLQSVLSSLQNGREFEQNLITDSNNDTYLQIRLFNSETSTFDAPIYYNAAGVLSVPLPPLTLVNPQFVLENIQSLLSSINAVISVLDRDFGASTVNTLRVVLEESQNDLLELIESRLNTITTNTDVLPSLDKNAGVVSANTLRVILADNQESILESLDIRLNDISTLLQNFDRNLGAATGETLRVALSSESQNVLDGLGNLNKDSGEAESDTLRTVEATRSQTPGLQRNTSSGTLLADSYLEVSIMNTGVANGTLLGATLKPGERVTYRAQDNSSLGAITFDATGTEFLISTITL